MTKEQRAVAESIAETLERGEGLHIEADACASIVNVLRALLTEARVAEAEAWETVEAVAEVLKQATLRCEGFGITAERSTPIAAALRELLDPEQIVEVWAQRE